MRHAKSPAQQKERKNAASGALLGLTLREPNLGFHFEESPVNFALELKQPHPTNIKALWLVRYVLFENSSKPHENKEGSR